MPLNQAYLMAFCASEEPVQVGALGAYGAPKKGMLIFRAHFSFTFLAVWFRLPSEVGGLGSSARTLLALGGGLEGVREPGNYRRGGVAR